MAERVGFEPTCRFWRQDAFEAPPLRPLRYLSRTTSLAKHPNPGRITRGPTSAPVAKELLHELPGLRREHAGDDDQPMVESRVLVRALGGLDRAGLRLGGAENQCPDPRVDDG